MFQMLSALVLLVLSPPPPEVAEQNASQPRSLQIHVSMSGCECTFWVLDVGGGSAFLKQAMRREAEPHSTAIIWTASNRLTRCDQEARTEAAKAGFKSIIFQHPKP